MWVFQPWGFFWGFGLTIHQCYPLVRPYYLIDYSQKLETLANAATCHVEKLKLQKCKRFGCWRPEVSTLLAFWFVTLANNVIDQIEIESKKRVRLFWSRVAVNWRAKRKLSKTLWFNLCIVPCEVKKSQQYFYWSFVLIQSGSQLTRAL